MSLLSFRASALAFRAPLCQHCTLHSFSSPSSQCAYLNSGKKSWLGSQFLHISLDYLNFETVVYIFYSLVTMFVSVKGLDHVAESILSYLDADSLCYAELVCKEWYRVISEGMLWKKLIERKVRTDSLWRGLAEKRGW